MPLEKGEGRRGCFWTKAAGKASSRLVALNRAPKEEYCSLCMKGRRERLLLEGGYWRQTSTLPGQALSKLAQLTISSSLGHFRSKLSHGSKEP